jgi:serine protease SohB
VTELAADYGLFLARLLTLVILALAVFAVIASTRRGARPDGLTVRHLNKHFEESADLVKRTVLGKERFKHELKTRLKERKKEQRARKRADGRRKRIFVLDFKGDIRASAGASLRQEVSAVLAVAEDEDHVLVRLENSGGLVHEHGFAASQLVRIRQRGLRLLVSVDKVAASGGYLMACVAHHLMAAPFAIVGSIGVLAQLPNFNRLLEEKGVDYEQIWAGEYKRTLTLFGKNTDEGRRKLREELEDVHELFKSLVREHRPQVDLERAATGEHWYGVRALDLKLVDELRTSDDFLLEAAKERDLYHVSYRRRRPLPERLFGGIESLLSR